MFESKQINGRFTESHHSSPAYPDKWQRVTLRQVNTVIHYILFKLINHYPTILPDIIWGREGYFPLQFFQVGSSASSSHIIGRYGHSDSSVDWYTVRTKQYTVLNLKVNDLAVIY